VRALAVAAAALLLAGCAAPAADPEPASEGPTGTVTVLAAASLTDVFDDLAARFEAEHPGVDVVLSYGGSSALAEQVVSGSPADVFASANESTMAIVSDAGLAVAPVVFATNSLELVVSAGNPGGVTGLADLARPELAVALCDPVVPCGSAAQRLLDRVGVVARVDTLEEDVRAVLTKVALGEVDAALVYRTDAIAAGADVEGIEVPEAASLLTRYPVALLADARNPAAAQSFVDFVLGEVGRRVLTGAGFGAP
jgi:molybdenum ABC transporter, periplasmic molybdate-binding protein